MNPNINLHIDSIVLDGIDLGPGQSQVLQQAVASQLTTMLTEQLGGGSANRSNQAHITPGCLGQQTLDTRSFSSQVATAIYSHVPQAHIGLRDTSGGRA